MDFVSSACPFRMKCSHDIAMKNLLFSSKEYKGIQYSRVLLCMTFKGTVLQDFCLNYFKLEPSMSAHPNR
jgi:hypothetical protein